MLRREDDRVHVLKIVKKMTTTKQYIAGDKMTEVIWLLVITGNIWLEKSIIRDC